MKKKFTLVVITEDDHLPKWIYDAHMSGEFINSLRAETIANGDLVEKYYDALAKIPEE